MRGNASVIIRPSLEEIFLTGWEHCRVILFSAPCGCGKTTTATALLAGHSVCTLNAAGAEFLPENIPPDCDAVLVDDLQYLLEPERRDALCALIRTRTDLHFVLLGRGLVPGWLMPFQFAGVLLAVETQALLFDRATAQRMLEPRGIVVTPGDMTAIQRDLKGYPIAMDILCRLLTLMSRLGEIQARGTPDIEFAAVGLLARAQVSQGKAQSALKAVENLREKFLETGQTRFLPNIGAMLCRLGDTDAAQTWLRERAPRDDVRLWAMWRYQYLTRAMVQILDGEYRGALLLLARLKPYCKHCGRVMDGIYIRMFRALCMERMGDAEWKAKLCAAPNTCFEYKFVWPVAQYGAAILSLLDGCGWDGDAAYLNELISATRTQAVQYPRFLKPQAQPIKPLSAAEMQVLKLLCQNLSNQEIGEIPGIKLPTVKTHVSRILQKLGVSRRSGAKTAAEKLRLI